MRTVIEYITVTNHVACMYSHLPFMSPMYKRQMSPQAKSVQIACCKLSQSWIY